MEKEQNKKEEFWYKITIKRCDERGYEEKERFALIMKFEPQNMYELCKGIMDFSVSDRDYIASNPTTLINNKEKE